VCDAAFITMSVDDWRKCAQCPDHAAICRTCLKMATGCCKAHLDPKTHVVIGGFVYCTASACSSKAICSKCALPQLATTGAEYVTEKDGVISLTVSNSDRTSKWNDTPLTVIDRYRWSMVGTTRILRQRYPSSQNTHGLPNAREHPSNIYYKGIE
jgi:hypothetical protein